MGKLHLRAVIETYSSKSNLLIRLMDLTKQDIESKENMRWLWDETVALEACKDLGSMCGRVAITVRTDRNLENASR
ncbi:hypothetical protein F511_32551 [Dorcoceras hygrometricum]|uniref:Uncharacterized protein n=1 Tax=Dorcoceras hygrometricum TaxID=472368 RepID=A0A2Z7C890_9LAMI|nr:hypothetical protein F511_32551 [Dorcoceras hygrometricum]